MDTMQAFALGEVNRGKEMMIFDWEKAARLIVEHKADSASAGLAGDWDWTGGEIFGNGAPVLDSYTYLGSTWATPEIEIDGEIFACFRMKSETPDWSAETKWPAEAVAILAQESGA